jgi:hypothetical protein
MTPKFGFQAFEPALNVFRLGATIFAWGLGLAAIWILTVEFIRPSLPYFPDTVAAAETVAAHRGGAAAAARIGLIRGSLWTDYAMSLAPDLPGGLTDTGLVNSLAALESTRAAAVRAAEFAPYDSRAWLLIAKVDSQDLDHNAAGPLKMSYYTGPNENPIIPLRITIATGSDAIADPDPQILVGGEIRTIITRRPDLKPVIIAAYRSAQPEGRRFIESQVIELDPDLLASVRAIR